MPQIQIIAASAAYFTREPMLEPDGEQRVNPDTNAPVSITRRYAATRGQIVEVTEHEANRLIGLEAARTPSDAPLPGSVRVPTPFGMPVRTDDGEDMFYTGPVMGDPAPGPQEEVGKTVGGLTPEQAAEFERQASEGVSGDEGGDEPIETTPTPENLDMNEVTEEDLLLSLEEHKPNVEQTLALAMDEDGDLDPDLAQKLLNVEESRDKPRAGVVDPLTEVVENDNEE